MAVYGIAALLLGIVFFVWLNRKHVKKEEETLDSFISDKLPSMDFTYKEMSYKMADSTIMLQHRSKGISARNLVCRTTKGDWFNLFVNTTSRKIFPGDTEVFVTPHTLTDQEAYDHLTRIASPRKLFPGAMEVFVTLYTLTDREAYDYLLELGESTLAEKHFGRLWKE